MRNIDQTQRILESFLSNAVVAFAGDKVKEVSASVAKSVLCIGGEAILLCTATPIDKTHKPTVLWGYDDTAEVA